MKKYESMRNDELEQFIIDRGIASEEAVNLVLAVCGRSKRILNDIIYVNTGNRDAAQFVEENGE